MRIYPPTDKPIPGDRVTITSQVHRDENGDLYVGIEDEPLFYFTIGDHLIEGISWHLNSMRFDRATSIELSEVGESESITQIIDVSDIQPGDVVHFSLTAFMDEDGDVLVATNRNSKAVMWINFRKTDDSRIVSNSALKYAAMIKMVDECTLVEIEDLAAVKDGDVLRFAMPVWKNINGELYLDSRQREFYDFPALPLSNPLFYEIVNCPESNAHVLRAAGA